MAINEGLKANYVVESKLEAFYTGGKVQISQDGQHIFCQCGDQVKVLDVHTGRISHSLPQGDEEEITSFVLSPDDKVLVVATKNFLKKWNWQEQKCVRTWKALHVGPVLGMAFDPTSTLVATASSDSTVKIWDVVQQYCTHNLRGSQGVVGVVEFHPKIDRLKVFTSSTDCKIRVWDLTTAKCVGILEGHLNPVTSLSFVPADPDRMLSGGRDMVVTLWDLATLAPIKTIPVFEAIESVLIIPPQQWLEPSAYKVASHDDICFVVAGSKGQLSVWSCHTESCLHSAPSHPASSPALEAPSPVQTVGFSQAALCQASHTVMAVTLDHNILTYSAPTLQLHKQYVGYNDEVLDVQLFGEGDTHLAVATNSPQIRVFELASHHCQILTGHSDIVVCLDVSAERDFLASASKDNTIRLWRKAAAGSQQIDCVAVGLGHTHAIGAVAWSRMSNRGFLVSGSEDLTLKLWQMPEPSSGHGEGAPHLRVRATEKAHDKDINSVVVSPNDQVIASGSQDKTVRIWSAATLSLLGTCRGHRRGVWSTQFSPLNQSLASSSADGTIKIWSVTDMSCLQTFEGHDASVLKVCFLSNGGQLLSSGSDGLIKLWTISSNQCMTTFDLHQDKAWALTTNASNSLFISGAADSTIIIWKDVTDIEREEQMEKQEHQLLKQQELSNLVQEKKYLKALGLAITLDRPYQVLNVLKEILQQPDGGHDLELTLNQLRPDQTASLIQFAVEWNTNAKHCHLVQALLDAVLRNTPPATVAHYHHIKESLEALIPYTERHFQRMSRLLQQAAFLDYTWNTIKLVATQPARPIMTMTESQKNGGHTTLNFPESDDDQSDLDDNTLAASTSMESVKKSKEGKPKKRKTTSRPI